MSWRVHGTWTMAVASTDAPTWLGRHHRIWLATGEQRPCWAPRHLHVLEGACWPLASACYGAGRTSLLVRPAVGAAAEFQRDAESLARGRRDLGVRSEPAAASADRVGDPKPAGRLGQICSTAVVADGHDG